MNNVHEISSICMIQEAQQNLENSWVVESLRKLTGHTNWMCWKTPMPTPPCQRNVGKKQKKTKMGPSNGA